MITLFAELPPSRRGPSAFMVSTVLHGFAIGLLYLGLRHAVRVEDTTVAQRYTVRLLSLWRPEPPMHKPVERRIAPAIPGPQGETASGGEPPAPSLPQRQANLIPAPQTLVQPDLPPNLVLPEKIPIPPILIWSPENTTARMILPPPPQERTTANVQPDLTAPNREMELADLKISASTFVTDAPLPVPSTTSPVVIHGPEASKQVSETTSKPLGAPTAARVLSLSDLRLERGTIALPLVNEIAAASASDAMAPVREVNSSGEGNGNAASKQNGIGAGATPGNQAGQGAGANGVGRQEGAKNGPDTGASQVADAGSGDRSRPAWDAAGRRIRRGRDAGFGWTP